MISAVKPDEPASNFQQRDRLIDGIYRKDSPKVLRVERDQMISAVGPDGPDQAFSISVLPGRVERGEPVPDAGIAHAPASLKA
jgi:hypothetical protein